MITTSGKVVIDTTSHRIDLANGVGVAGVRQASRDPFPETVALLESLMAVKAN